MTRSALILAGLALIAAGLTLTLTRLHVDGLSALAIAGLIVVILANRWDTPAAR